jgi:hypothetical protein
MRRAARALTVTSVVMAILQIPPMDRISPG